ncbi:ribosome maturation factor RimP [Magnetospira sp. QH-2]|uniref:ribosome maturation factor RimP n=1 Tax=Magnetospira sp. (strain QH-2) TaxID=1288970 RepID=UPI0003E81527|nr:ribosome maturation factor RimP [Magnetospira sp. QH-2]CCQ75716.1 conserved protein of unknown function, similar to Ribosome maturation factor RimP from E.coli [Magnetospira sp. QH-2]
MELSIRIAELIGPTIEDMGYDLVRVQTTGNRHMTLQIMAEPSDGRDMNVDDCATVSRAVSALLDVEDPIEQNYTLEVSSPGLDRPLTRPKDFVRYAGFEAKVELARPQNGQRRFRGILGGMEEESVLLDMEDGAQAALPFDEIARAKLVLNDHLMAEAGNRNVTEASGRDADEHG